MLYIMRICNRHANIQPKRQGVEGTTSTNVLGIQLLQPTTQKANLNPLMYKCWNNPKLWIKKQVEVPLWYFSSPLEPALLVRQILLTVRRHCRSTVHQGHQLPSPDVCVQLFPILKSVCRLPSTARLATPPDAVVDWYAGLPNAMFSVHSAHEIIIR